ncbi:MAG: hypothetical protein KJJ56_17030, partial [Serratia rubidaea]|nr:hypothetical protein [Serratia rubidaea]
GWLAAPEGLFFLSRLPVQGALFIGIFEFILPHQAIGIRLGSPGKTIAVTDFLVIFQRDRIKFVTEPASG